MKTVDNSGNPTYWAGCWHTDRPNQHTWGNFTNGVPRHIFELSEKLVCEEGSYYSHIHKSDYKTPKEKEYWFQAQQSGWASLLRTIEYLKNNTPRRTKKEFLEDKNW